MKVINEFDQPQELATVLEKLPNPEHALKWGKQTFGHGVIEGMILLASKETEHYRYALGVSLGIAQVLYEPVQTTVVEPEHFIRCKQNGTLIGHYDTWEVHVIQEVPEDMEEEVLLLLILNDDRKVVGYVQTRIRAAQDHVVTMIKRT